MTIKTQILKKSILKPSAAAFSLTEVMVVVVVIGTVAAFGIPSYSKAVDKTIARDMVNNLRILGAGQENYKAANGRYFFTTAGGGATQADLNTNLGLNLISQRGVVYQCIINTGAPSTTGYCEAVYAGGPWAYRISTAPAIQPAWSQIVCQSGTCPAGVP